MDQTVPVHIVYDYYYSVQEIGSLYKNIKYIDNFIQNLFNQVFHVYIIIRRILNYKFN